MVPFLAWMFCVRVCLSSSSRRQMERVVRFRSIAPVGRLVVSCSLPPVGFRRVDLPGVPLGRSHGAPHRSGH